MNLPFRLALLLTLMIFILFFTGCTEITIEDAIENEGINYNNIFYVEDSILEDGAIVFYENSTSKGALSICYLEKTRNGWKWVSGGGNAEINPREGLSWIVSMNKEMATIYGIIENSKIKQVRVKQLEGDFDREAKIVETDTGKRLWFIINKQPIQPPIEIIGYAENGEVIFSH